MLLSGLDGRQMFEDFNFSVSSWAMDVDIEGDIAILSIVQSQRAIPTILVNSHIVY